MSQNDDSHKKALFAQQPGQKDLAPHNGGVKDLIVRAAIAYDIIELEGKLLVAEADTIIDYYLLNHSRSK